MEKDTRRLGEKGEFVLGWGAFGRHGRGGLEEAWDLRFVAKFACEGNFFLTGGVVELRALEHAEPTRGVGRLTSKELLSR